MPVTYATGEQEAEANAFAFELLMPAHLVREHAAEVMRDWPPGKRADRDRIVARLADTFDVTTEHMAARLYQLGIFTC